MPYRVRSRNCQKADGSSGNAVVEKKRTDGSWTQIACTDDKQEAHAVKSRIEENENG